MARNFVPPPEYAPGLMLDLREQPEGGELPARGELRGRLEGLPRPECVVLVHGFNNHYGEAGERYYGFRVMQRRHFDGEHGDIADGIDDCMDAGGRATPGAVAEARAAGQGWPVCGFADGIEARAAGRIRSPTRFARSSCRNNRPVCGFAAELERLLGDAFWPGDADWPGPLDWLDALVYPAAVHTAQQAAVLLADLIERIPGLLRAHFVAHSLGCRVVLETLNFLWARGRLSIGAICLMAASVERDTVAPGGRFADLLAALGEAGSEILVLHSRRDQVLRFTFPLGQTGAGEGFLPEALGLEGPPPGMPGRVTGRRVAGANHGDYWGQQDNEPSRFATRETGAFLKLGERVREIRARQPEAARAVGEARAID